MQLENNMKHCPFCYEAIKKEAIFCKFCKSDLKSLKPTTHIANGPNPNLAAILSFLIPGLGQIYAGKVLRGVLFFISAGIGILLFVIPGILIWIVNIIDAYNITSNKN